MNQNFLEAQLLFSASRHFHLSTHFRNSIYISDMVLPGIHFFSCQFMEISCVVYDCYSVGDPGHFLTCANYPYVMKSFQETLSHYWCSSFRYREEFIVHWGCYFIISTWIALIPGSRTNYTMSFGLYFCLCNYRESWHCAHLKGI